MVHRTRYGMLAALALLAAGLPAGAQAAQPPAAGAGEPRPYVFTQVHRDDLPWWQGTWRPQAVPSGARVQVQLPGGPTVWTLEASCEPTPSPSARADGAATGRATLEPQGREILPSPNRIAGTDSIYQFDFIARGEGLAAVCLTAHPPSPPNEAAGSVLGPADDYRLTLKVVPK
jgi:hypothetical protein